MRRKNPKNPDPKLPQPKMWGAPEKSTKRISMDNEQRLSEEVGFTLTPASGNQPWPGRKGDGSHPMFVFECKETKHARISVGEREVAKLCRQAGTVGKDPALVLSIYSLPDPIPKDWVAVPAHVFRSLLEKAVRHGKDTTRMDRNFRD